MESQYKITATARRNFGPTARWKGKQRLNVHYLHEKGFEPHEIAEILALPIEKITSTLHPRPYVRKPYKPPEW